MNGDFKEAKFCLCCGRTMEWRKAWEKNWEQVRYCSESCRRNKNQKSFTAEILELVTKRYPNSICPSEVLSPEDKQSKELMEQVRRSARLLAREQQIVITQKNQIVDPDHFRGPIRLKLKR